MRVLMCPYIYHQRSLSACSNVTEAKNWIDSWLEQADDDLHVTWMLPPKSETKWSADEINLHDDRVDVIENRRFMQGTDFRRVDGWREEQLIALRDLKKNHHAYFDVVINQQLYSHQDLWRFLSELYDVTFSQGDMFYGVSHVHDFNSPWKEHGGRYPNDSEVVHELSYLAYCDDIWLKCPSDGDQMIKHAGDWLSRSKIKEIDDKTTHIGMSMNLEKFDLEYSDEPEYVHVAGTNESAKNWDDVFDVCKFLYQRFGIETIRTSMKEVEDSFKGADWAECHSNAPYDTYQDTLDRGDICIAMPEYATGGKAYYEQGVSGQVMIFWERPWVSDHIPDDYKLKVGKKGAVTKMAAWVVKNWSDAVDEHERAMEHFIDICSKDAVGEVTFDRLQTLEQQRIDSYDPSWDADVLPDVMEYLGEGPHTISSINKASSRFTDTGNPVLDLWTYPLSDMILCLKSLGYKDVGGKEPAFVEA